MGGAIEGRPLVVCELARSVFLSIVSHIAGEKEKQRYKGEEEEEKGGISVIFFCYFVWFCYLPFIIIFFFVKNRANELLSKCTIIPDDPSERTKTLPQRKRFCFCFLFICWASLDYSPPLYSKLSFSIDFQKEIESFLEQVTNMATLQ